MASRTKKEKYFLVDLSNSHVEEFATLEEAKTWLEGNSDVKEQLEYGDLEFKLFKGVEFEIDAEMSDVKVTLTEKRAL